MLVLSRQRDETIMIGDDVEITVVDIRGDKVRVGISAPRHVQVHRKEVYEAIKRENTEASQIGVNDLPGQSAAGQSEAGQDGASKDGAGKDKRIRPVVPHRTDSTRPAQGA